MVIGSDGLWDVMSSGDVVGFVNDFLPKEGKFDLAKNTFPLILKNNNKSL